MKLITILISTLLLSSCGARSTSHVEDKNEGVVATELTVHPGYKLYKMYCIACHGGTASPGQRLAPPAFMVKDHYKSFEKEEFIARVSHWIESPDEEQSLMPGAIRNFDLMPPLPLAIKDREKIAEYFFLTDFEEPVWAAEHMRKEQQKRNNN
jgi:mono/diheme cytochrome c family protein